MTKSDKVKKHGFVRGTNPAEEDPSPPPQRGSTQSTVISPPFPARTGVRVNTTSHENDDWAYHQSPIRDWAEYKSPDASGPSQRKRSRIDAGLKTPEGNFAEGAWPELELLSEGDAGIQHQPPKPIPRYLVVESITPDKPLTKCNIFAVNKWFKGVSTLLSGKVRKIGNCFLVDCPTERVAKKLLSRDGTEFISLKLKVSAHRTLNSSKGVIWCPDLEGIADAEILDNLRDEGVEQVERCMKKKGGLKVPTHTFFLTFSRPTLPESIVISCYLKCKVSLFVPKPLQCFTCFRFGHPSAKCKKKDKPICGRCGHEAHEGDCPQPALCPNCKSAHAPTSRQCPTYKKEALIKKIMVQKKIPFKAAKLEAEKEIEGSVPQQGKSYANAAAAATGMQTPTPNLSAPNKTKSQKQSQSGTELPGAIRAEALAAAIDLRETLRATKNSTKAKPTAPGSNGAQKTPKSKKKNRGRANKAQAKPGNNTAPAPQAAVDKQAPKPAKQPASKAGHSSATVSAPQVTVAKQASKPNQRPAPKADQPKDPASAPQAAGSKQTTSAEQAPVPSTSKAKPGDTPAPALQAAEMEQATETPLPSSDTESEMEVTSESAPQATEVKQGTAEDNKGDSSGSPATSPDSLKNGLSFAAAAKEGPQTTSKKETSGGYKFEIKLAKANARKKPWSRKPRQKGEEPPIPTQNKFSPLDGYGFMDPEEIDPNASFPNDLC